MFEIQYKNSHKLFPEFDTTSLQLDQFTGTGQSYTGAETCMGWQTHINPEYRKLTKSHQHSTIFSLKPIIVDHLTNMRRSNILESQKTSSSGMWWILSHVNLLFTIRVEWSIPGKTGIRGEWTEVLLGFSSSSSASSFFSVFSSKIQERIVSQSFKPNLN